MNNNYESHAISRRSFLKASGVVGAAGILAACGGSASFSYLLDADDARIVSRNTLEMTVQHVN